MTRRGIAKIVILLYTIALKTILELILNLRFAYSTVTGGLISDGLCQERTVIERR